MGFIVSTLLTAFPVILPVIILLIAKLVGYRYPVQKPLMMTALALYALALLAFAAHGWITGLGPGEFFRAYYGHPAERTWACMTGYAGQALAVVALLFVVNWSTVRLFFLRPNAKKDAGSQAAEGESAFDKAADKTSEKTFEQAVGTSTAPAEGGAAAGEPAAGKKR